MSFVDDPRFAASVEKRGGPGPFTLAFVKHVQKKGQDKLTPMEKSAWAAIKKYGVDGFAAKVSEKFPDIIESSKATGGGVGGFLERAGGGLLAGLEAPAAAGRAISEAASTPLPPGHGIEAVGQDVLQAAGGLLQFPEEIVKQVGSGQIGEAGLSLVGAPGIEATGQSIGEKGLKATLQEHPLLTPLTIVTPFLVGLGTLGKAASAAKVQKIAPVEVARLKAGEATPSAAFVDLARTQPFDAAALQRQLAETQPIPGLAEAQAVAEGAANARVTGFLEALADRGQRRIPTRFRGQSTGETFQMVEQVPTPVKGIALGEQKVVPRETPGGGTFLEQHHAVVLPAESPVRDIAYEPQFEIGGQPAVELFSNPFVRAVAGAIDSTLGALLMEKGQQIKKALQSESTKPGTFTLSKTRPAEAGILQRYAASEGAARTVAILQNRRLNAILGSPVRVQQFWEVMNDGQIRAVAARKTAAGETPFRESLMSDEARAKLLANPQIVEARAFWKEHVQPEIERLAPQAAVDAFRYDADGLYAPLNWLKEEGGKWVDRYGQAEGAINKRVGGGRSRIMTRRKARAAQTAAGTADRYSVDSLHNMANMYRDRYGAADQNAVIDMLKAHSVEVPKGSAPPKGYVFAGDTLPNLAVPEDIGAAYHSIRDLRVSGEAVGVMGLGRQWITSTSLWGPFDAISTFLRVSSAVYRLPQLAPGSGIVARLTAVTKALPEMGRIIAEAANIHGAEATVRMRNLARHGALRATAFLELEKNVGAARGLQKAAFALPEFERGTYGGRSLIGYDTRFRVMYDGLLERLGVKEASKRAAIINNEIGTYVKALQPALVRSLAHVDPFAASHVATLKSQAKALGGISAATGRFSPEVLWSTVGTAIATPILLNYTLNGKFPWQVPDLRPGDVRFTHDGKNYDISYRMLLAPISRTLGPARAALDQVWNGSARWEDAAMASVRGAFDEAILFIGPALQVPYVAVTGKALYIDPRTGEQIQLAQKSMHQFRENLRAARDSIIQIFPNASTEKTPDTVTGKLSQWLAGLGQQALGIRQRGSTKQLEGGIVGRAKARRYEIAQGASFVARKAKDAAAQAGEPFAPHDTIAADLTKKGLDPGTKDFRFAYKIALRLYRIRGKSLNRNAAEARRERARLLSDDEGVN